MNKKNKKCLLIILIYNLGLVNILFNWKAVIYIYTCRFLKVYLESMWLKPNPKPNSKLVSSGPVDANSLNFSWIKSLKNKV